MLQSADGESVQKRIEHRMHSLRGMADKPDTAILVLESGYASVSYDEVPDRHRKLVSQTQKDGSGSRDKGEG